MCEKFLFSLRNLIHKDTDLYRKIFADTKAPVHMFDKNLGQMAIPTSEHKV